MGISIIVIVASLVKTVVVFILKSITVGKVQETVAKRLKWDVLCVFNNFVGGQIHSSYHSATFSNGAPTVLVFGVPLWYDVKTPRVVIQVGLQKLMRQSKDSARVLVQCTALSQ